MQELISAADARAKIDQALTLSAQTEWSEIKQKITEAIEGNKSSIDMNKLTPANREKLIALGYKVSSGGRYNEADYYITW